MYTYKIIIFDLDGTLFKTDTIFIDAVHQICQSRGMKPIDTKILLKLIGKTIPDICRELIGKNISDKEIDAIMTELKCHEGKSFREKVQLYKGVKNMLYSLKSDGYKLGICTNGSKEYLYTILDYFDIRQYFQIIKTGADSLEKYQMIKQILDENASTSAIIVGDTSIDFDAADETRCISIGVSYGYGEDSYKDSDFIASTPEDIYKIVRKINGLYRNIAAQLLREKQNNKPLIVGIKGVDAYGISIFARELSGYLFKTGFNSRIISIDDIHNPSHPGNMEKDPVIYIQKYNPEELSNIIIDSNNCWNPEIIKEPALKNIGSNNIKLEDVEEKHIYEIGKMLREDEAREMLDVISIPVLSDYKSKNNISKAITDESNKFIGVVELFNISWKNRRGELSIAIMPEMRKKGYGYAAINKILEIAFLEYGMNKVWLRVSETNTKAISLYNKAGFIREGICRSESMRKGQFINQIQMSILANEWIRSVGK